VTKKTVLAASELSGIGSKGLVSEYFVSVFIMIGEMERMMRVVRTYLHLCSEPTNARWLNML